MILVLLITIVAVSGYSLYIGTQPLQGGIGGNVGIMQGSTFMVTASAVAVIYLLYFYKKKGKSESVPI